MYETVSFQAALVGRYQPTYCLAIPKDSITAGKRDVQGCEHVSESALRTCWWGESSGPAAPGMRS